MNDKPKKLEFSTSHEVGTTATDEDLQSKRSRPSSRGAGSSKMIESRFDHAEDVVVRWHLGYSERAKQQRIFECPEEEASTYLEAVDEVQNLLDQLSVQNKEEEQQPATLERAQNVIQLKACPNCDGYGVQQCHVCEGQGKLIWEGKLQRTDPCPLCFGSCLKKCRLCGGTKMKRGIPPNLQTQPAQNLKKS
jgi:hypothetical protein